MRTYREELEKVTECSGENNYLTIEQDGVYDVLNEIESEIDDVLILIKDYEIKEAYEKLLKIKKGLY